MAKFGLIYKLEPIIIANRKTDIGWVKWELRITLRIFSMSNWVDGGTICETEKKSKKLQPVKQDENKSPCLRSQGRKKNASVRKKLPITCVECDLGKDGFMA